MVYIKEAHALDGARAKGGRDGNPLVEDPVTLAERIAVADTCAAELDLSPMTVVADDMKNSTCYDYDASPERLYLVDEKGRVAFVGGKGPARFDPDAWERAIEELLAKKKR